MAFLDVFRKLFGGNKPKSSKKKSPAAPQPPQAEEPAIQAPQAEAQVILPTPQPEVVPQSPAQILAITCIGQSHIKQGTVCQDSSLCHQGRNFRVIAVSDGHGSSAFPRSDRGSQLACRIALEVCSEFAEKELPPDREQAAKALCSELLQRWKTAVLADHASDPFSEAELETVSEKYRGLYQIGSHVEHAYGATVIAVVESAAGILALRCGDGECVAIDDRGDFSRPIPWNDKCDVNVTTSLCDPDALEEFRWVWLDTAPAAIWIGTDGVDNSYPDPADLNEFYANLSTRALEQGCNRVLQELQQFLPVLTQRCSQDDLSVAAMLDQTALTAARDRLCAYLELRRTLRQKEELQRRLRSTQRTLQNKAQKLAQNAGDPAALEAEIAALREEESRLAASLAQLQQEET